MKKIILFFCVFLFFLVSCEEENAEKNFKLSPVELISPNSDEINQPLNVYLKWRNTNSKWIVYNCDVFLGESKENLVCVDSNIWLGSRELKEYECFALKLNTKYYWKINIKAEDQHMESEVFEFTTTDRLPSIEFQNSTLMVFPSDYKYPYEDSLKNYITLHQSGAFNLTDGSYNTSMLMADYDRYPMEGMYVAAKYCNDLNAYGYSDWYLPSVVELDSINNQLELVENSNDIYWTSNEYVEAANWGHTIQHRPYTNINGDYARHNKFFNFKCRCVRRE